MVTHALGRRPKTMGFYDDRVLPYLVHFAMRQEVLSAFRRRIVPAAHGCVLEIGVGSGFNLQLYGATVTRVIGLDTSPRLLAMARQRSALTATRIDLLEASAESVPLGDASVDTVVTTWTLCSIPNVALALREMRRVLKPCGMLQFVEHGRAPDGTVERWQDRLTPVWKRLAGGCHLNRPIRDLIEGAGFHVESIEVGYIQAPRPMTYMYEGRARPT
jgi:ubiquinone/menaquinone biosynthesis C-methylase UbiE